jgi:hypothetical protein
MQAKMLENQRLLDEMNKSWEQRLQEAQTRMAAQQQEAEPDYNSHVADGGKVTEMRRREEEPHILNIHEDPMLSRAICHFFPKGRATVFGNRRTSYSTSIGSSCKSMKKADILLAGLSVRPNHCTVNNNNGELSLTVGEGCKVLENDLKCNSSFSIKPTSKECCRCCIMEKMSWVGGAHVCSGTMTGYV